MEEKTYSANEYSELEIKVAQLQHEKRVTSVEVGGDNEVFTNKSDCMILLFLYGILDTRFEAGKNSHGESSRGTSQAAQTGAREAADDAVPGEPWLRIVRHRLSPITL